MTVTVSRGRTSLVVRAPFELRERVKRVPGYEWDRDSSTWRFPLDAGAYGALRDEFPDLTGDAATEGWFRETSEHIRTLERILALGDVTDLLYELRDDLHAYQRVAVRYMVAAGCALLGDRMGLGKTVMAIATIRELELRGEVDGGLYLIVCPNSKLHDWRDEIVRWHPADAEVTIADGEPRSKEPGFYLVNWEKTWRRQWLTAWEWDVLVCDESHRMKGRDTRQSKAARKVRARHRFLLTGTPIKNFVVDLWPQLVLLQPERWSSFWKFFDRYVDFREGFFGKEILGIRNADELNARLRSVMIARSIDDVELQLPDVRQQTIRVRLEGRQRDAYEEMRDQFVAWINDQETVTAANWLTQALRLKQIAGAMTVFDPTDRQSAKLDALEELLADAPDEKFVVMSQFRTMVDACTARLRDLKIPFAEMTGRACRAWVPPAGYRDASDRGELMRWFQTSNAPRVFVATTQTGGEGITLTAARYFVFLDLLWTPGDNEQAWSRIHRIGQHRACVVYSVLAKDTIDFSAILPTLRRKEDVVEAIMRPRS